MEGDEADGDLRAGEEVDLLAAQALMKCGEWDGAASAEADYFAIEDEIAGDVADGLEEIGEFGDGIEGSGIDFDLRIALVERGADAVKLVFQEGAVGEGGDEVGGSLRGTGEHDGDGAEELERDGRELVGDGEAEDVGDVTEEHVGALDGGESLVEGFGYGLFDEVFFQADAQFAGGDFDEVLGFEGGEALECVLEESLFGGRAALLCQRGVDFGDLLKAEGRAHGMVTQDFFGACAEVAVTAEDRSDLGGILFCKLGDRAKENREANREDALFAAREDSAAEVKGGEVGLLDRCGAEIVGHQADFFVLFGGRGDGFAELGETEHGEE